MEIGVSFINILEQLMPMQILKAQKIQQSHQSFLRFWVCKSCVRKMLVKLTPGNKSF
jgi:hypothetical protein